MYTKIDAVFQRINSFDFDYEQDEQEALRTYTAVESLDPFRTHRVRLILADAYSLKV